MGLIHFRTNRLLHLDLSPPERCIMHSRPEQKGKKCSYAHVPIHRAPYGVITEADRLDLFWFGRVRVDDCDQGHGSPFVLDPLTPKH